MYNLHAAGLVALAVYVCQMDCRLVMVVSVVFLRLYIFFNQG